MQPRLAENPHEAERGVVNMEELVNRRAVPAHQDGLPFANTIDPREIPGYLPERTDCRAVSRRRLDDGDREALPVECLEIEGIGLGLLFPVRSDGTEWVVLGHRQPVVLNAVGADRGAMDELLHPSKGPQAALRVFAVEADHIDGSVETFGLHRLLESRSVLAVAEDRSGPNRSAAALPAVEAGDVVPLLQQHSHDAVADVPGTADYAYSHGYSLNTVATDSFLHGGRLRTCSRPRKGPSTSRKNGHALDVRGESPR